MREDILDKSTDTENKVSRHQDNNVGVVVASMHHRHASSNSKGVSDVARQGTSPSQRSAMASHVCVQ